MCRSTIAKLGAVPSQLPPPGHRPTVADSLPQGALLVQGFSECCVEFHLDTLLRFWDLPKPHLATWWQEAPGQLAEVLEVQRPLRLSDPAHKLGNNIGAIV